MSVTILVEDPRKLAEYEEYIVSEYAIDSTTGFITIRYRDEYLSFPIGRVILLIRKDKENA